MLKKQRGAKVNDGGLTSLKEQRDKLLKNDDQVVSFYKICPVHFILSI